MKSMQIMLAASALSLAAPALRAQDDQPPPYEKGPVWIYTAIKTKDGHFNDYMRWLDEKLKPEQEALKKAGRIIDYKVFIVTDARAGDPDIFIARAYPNMGAFDHSTAEDFALEQKVLGSVAQADQQQAARGSIRELMGNTMAREVTLK